MADQYRTKVEQEDPWKSEIEADLIKNHLSETTINYVLETVLNMELSKVDKRHDRRVADVLKQLGYCSEGKRDLQGRRLWIKRVEGA